MNSDKELIAIHLNRATINKTKVVRLYFKNSTIIYQRIKQNDWIKYSGELRAYYTLDTKENINSLRDLFSDIAYVNIRHLDWKPSPKTVISPNSIGNNRHDPAALRKRELKASIILFPIKMEETDEIGFKHFFPKHKYHLISDQKIMKRNNEKRNMAFFCKHK